jgi:hypothetical protein
MLLTIGVVLFIASLSVLLLTHIRESGRLW